MGPTFYKLTGRQQQVVRLLALGLTTKQIGERLFISTSTVKNHLAQAMTVYRARNRTHLVFLAFTELPKDERVAS